MDPSLCEASIKTPAFQLQIHTLAEWNPLAFEQYRSGALTVLRKKKIKKIIIPVNRWVVLEIRQIVRNIGTQQAIRRRPPPTPNTAYIPFIRPFILLPMATSSRVKCPSCLKIFFFCNARRLYSARRNLWPGRDRKTIMIHQINSSGVSKNKIF